MSAAKAKAPTSAAQVLDAVQANHVWVNAFSCINPSREFCEDLGRSIINMLANKENLLPSYSEQLLKEQNAHTRGIMVDLAHLTPTLYLRINKS